MDCLKVETTKIVGCSKTLLDNLWHKFENTRVVQCGYDLPCSEGECNPVIRFPYCQMDAACAHHQFSLWQDMLMLELNLKYPMYTGINILGTLQMLDKTP